MSFRKSSSPAIVVVVSNEPTLATGIAHRLDGIATAHHLCADQPLERRPWIIATTANAMDGDRETRLAAGMDDYLPKPIGGKLLTQVLIRTSQQLLLRC